MITHIRLNMKTCLFYQMRFLFNNFANHEKTTVILHFLMRNVMFA